MTKVLTALKLHHESFFGAHEFAEQTAQPTPEDSRAWSQIIVSLLTDINGLGRKKGPDLRDGSDVKSANIWQSIDTPRFNGVIKSGTKSVTSDKLESLDSMPFLFFVLWDNEPNSKKERVRIWVVRTQEDKLFRETCKKWYDLRMTGDIISNNFQLHPPRNKNLNVFRNTCGNLNYPLLFNAVWEQDHYEIITYDPDVLTNGECSTI
ncbi:MamI family restriction endonuclease [Alteribacter salitolerans]|uniref:MamI family restriction endonuclease n=1 Tax=Alteribacter salitolerans TaxID=2912333 RepID=UPI001EFFEAA0|nr:MamI family restriction endonuclease [Alteribacter salitolerans]